MYDVKAPSAELTCWRHAPTNWPCAAGDGDVVAVAGVAVGIGVGVGAGVGVGTAEQAPSERLATSDTTRIVAAAVRLGMRAKGSESPKSFL